MLIVVLISHSFFNYWPFFQERGEPVQNGVIDGEHRRNEEQGEDNEHEQVERTLYGICCFAFLQPSI